MQDRSDRRPLALVYWRQWAIAASLLVAASLAYFSALGSMIVAIYQPALESTPAIDIENGLSAPGEMFEFTVAYDENDGSDVLYAEEDPALVQAEEARKAWWGGSLADATSVPLEIQVDPPVPPAPLARSLFAQVRELFSRRSPGYVDPLTDVFLARHDFLAHRVEESVLKLSSPDAWPQRGVTPPNIPEADWQALIVEMRHPLVSPAAHRLLAETDVPLVTATNGYDFAWRNLLAAEMPQAALTRTEDVLAALNYEFEPPQDAALGLRTAAGPAPFGEAGMSLLQVGVQAREAMYDGAQPVQLTLAVDVSAAMSSSSQLDLVRRAIIRLATDLSPADRLTVVACGETSEVLLEDVHATELQLQLRVLATLEARGGTNLASGLRDAAVVARRLQTRGYQQRLVLVATSLGETSADLTDRLKLMVADLAQSGTTSNVVQVVSGRTPLDARLNELARAGKGSLRQVDSIETIHDALLEIVAGRSQLVARSTRLHVVFRPEVVAQYRLVGHEPTVAGGLEGGPLEVDIAAGQAATALFEIKLKPGGGDDVATATLSWIDPASGEEQSVTRRISRLQFATSVLESPLSLQRAAVAAQAAEVLRLGRSSAARTLGLKRIVQHAGQLPAYTRDEPTFAELLQFVDLALQVQTGRAAR